MRVSLQRTALWLPLLVAALLVGGYLLLHRPLAADETQLLQVPLSEEAPALDRVGDLKYLGGLDIPRMGQNIGGLSGLRWDADSQRLLAITDDARWVWITLKEADDRLAGIAKVESGPLLGLDGEPLEGKAEADSESLSSGPKPGSWIIGFEREHRIWLYKSLEGAPEITKVDVIADFGPLDANNGLEALASNDRVQFGCVERRSTPERPNCMASGVLVEGLGPFSTSPPKIIADLGGVPTDADALSDGTALILFRSYSPAQGNGAAIVSYASDGTRREIATVRPPLSVDNFEGLAVREEGKRTFLYIVSDDNFSGSQRTLLMKFEILPEE